MTVQWLNARFWHLRPCGLFSIFLLATFMMPFSACAETLSLQKITDEAIQNSYALKIARVEARINRADINIARADYFPTIRAGLNIERLKSLQNSPTQVTTIGTTVLPAGTRFQNSISLSVNHTLLDFGVRHHKIEMAKAATTAKISETNQILRDLKIKLIELYADALISYKTMTVNQALALLAQKQYKIKKQLYKAGTISTVPMAEDAIQVAQTLDNIQVYKDQYQQKLENISYYTHTEYNPESTALEDLSDDTATKVITVVLKQSAEAKVYDALIAQKQHEINSLKRQALPNLSWYSNYYIYGFDPNHFNHSVKDLSQRTVSLGLSFSMPVFDGFKNRATIEKAKLEKEKLQLQKDDKLAQLKNQASLYQQQVDGYTVQLSTKATILNKTQDKLTMVNRLSEQKIVDQTQAIKEHMDRIQKQVDVEKSIIQGVSALKKLKILAEG